MQTDTERFKQKFIERLKRTQGLVLDILSSEKLSQAQGQYVARLTELLDKDFTGDELLSNLQLLDILQGLLEARSLGEEEKDLERQLCMPNANTGEECYAAIN